MPVSKNISSDSLVFLFYANKYIYKLELKDKTRMATPAKQQLWSRKKAIYYQMYVFSISTKEFCSGY